MAQLQPIMFDQDWDQAIDNYNHITQRDIRKELGLRGLVSVEALASRIEASHKSFEGFRNHRPRLMEHLNKALRPLRMCGQLLQAATSLTPLAPASVVLGSVLYLFDGAEGLSNVYDAIYDLFKLIEDVTERMVVYQEALVDPKLQKILIKIVGTMLRIIGRSEKLIKRGRFQQFLVVTVFRKDDDVTDMMHELQQLVDSETRMVNALTSATVSRVERGVAWMAGNMEKANDDKARSEFEKNLKTPAYDKVYDIHTNLERTRMEGIGQWLFDQSLYQSWLDNEYPIVWLTGLRASGKSYLTSRVIHGFEKVHPQRNNVYPPVSIGYFYVKEGSESLHSTNSLFKTLAYQITKNDKTFERHAMNVSLDSDNFRTCEDTWTTLFEKFFLTGDGDSTAVVIVDALDEAPKEERQRLWQILSNARFTKTDTGQYRLRFFLVGRTEIIKDEIDEYWNRRSHPIIEVTSLKNSDDIGTYIEKSLPRVKILRDSTVSKRQRIDLRTMIRTTLKDGAMGTFLWVRLVLDTIKDQTRLSDIQATLKTAPRKLFEMIREIIIRLAADPNRRKDDLNELFLWVTFARREMLLGECRLVLKLKPPLDDPMTSLEDTLRGPYGSFFQLIRTDGKTTEDLQREQILQQALHNIEDPEHLDDNLDELDEPDDLDAADVDSVDIATNSSVTSKPVPHGSDMMTTTVQFTHARIRDYILQGDLVEGIGVHLQYAHQHITLICLQLLTDEIPKAHGQPWEKPDLLNYSANYVLDHLSEVDQTSLGNHERSEIARLVYLLMSNYLNIERWYIKGKLNVISDSLIHRPDNLGLIHRWINDVVYLSTLAAQEREKVEEFAKTPLSILKPIASTLGIAWLHYDGDNQEILDFLYPYSCLLGTELIGSEIDNKNMPARKPFKKLSSEEILLAARCGGQYESSEWHRIVGDTLREAGHFQSAQDEYILALGSWSENPQAYWGMALIFGHLDQLKRAVAEGRQALQKYEESQERHSKLAQVSNDQIEETGGNDLKTDEPDKNILDDALGSGVVHETDESDVDVDDQKQIRLRTVVDEDRINTHERVNIPVEENFSDETSANGNLKAATKADENEISNVGIINNGAVDREGTIDEMSNNEHFTDQETNNGRSGTDITIDKEPHLIWYFSRWQESDCWTRISWWLEVLNDYDDAIEAARKAFDLEPNVQHSDRVMFLYHTCSRYAEALDFVMELDRVEQDNTKLSRFHFFLMYGWSTIRHIARTAIHLGRISDLVSSLRKMVEIVEKFDEPTQGEALHAKALLAQVLFEYDDNEAEAIDLWDSVLDGLLMLDGEVLNGQQCLVAFELVIVGQSQMHLWKPRSTESGKGQEFLRKVEKLASFKPGSQDQKIAMSFLQESSQILYRWYMSQGHVAQAKDCLRPHILAAIAILSDEYIENDNAGWRELGRLLKCADDDNNAQAAYGIRAIAIDRARLSLETVEMSSDSPREHNHTRDGASLISTDNSPEMSFTDSSAPMDEEHKDITLLQPRDIVTEMIDVVCDGPCNRSATQWQTLHSCKVCPDIDFCDECFSILRQGKLPYKLCGADHPFLQVYPIAPEVVALATHKVNGNTLPRKEWLERIKDAWTE